MPRPTKIRVCTETEKRKAEMFNKIDDLIQTGELNEALDYLHYLYRNAPSVRAHVQRKLAQCYYELKNSPKCLIHIQDLIPSSDTLINKMVIESLLRLDKKNLALFHLARAPIPTIKKRELFFLIFPEFKEEYSVNKGEQKSSQVIIRCPICTKFLFFINNKPECLFCKIPKKDNSFL